MEKQNISKDWYFHLGDFNTARWTTPDVTGWRRLNLPHDWSIELNRRPENVSGVSGGFFPMGVGWYVKYITIPKEWKQKKVYIEFEGVYMNAEVWLNQNMLGRHPYGYTSFSYDLTPYLDWEHTNEIKVFVDNSHQLNSRWYSGSGIYRPVWLQVGDTVHVATWGVFVTTPNISDDSALLRIQTRLCNDNGAGRRIELRNRILDPGGNEVGAHESIHTIDSEEAEINQEIHIPDPELWSPDTPHLYQVITEVLNNGKVLDNEITIFGIRSIEFSAEKGFLLNGKTIPLKGGCVHHDNGILGAASYPRSEERKVELHKANGYNAIRNAHNPPAPAFLEACDRLGMLVIDEAFDCWQEGKNHGDYHVVFNDWWQRDLESMVYRDRNHPSIILWSIGNEVLERDGRGGGEEISKKLAACIRKLDPTRPVTAAICRSWHGGSWEEMDVVFATMDIGGYNYQWAQYNPDHKRLPGRIMMGTESFPLEAFESWRAVEEYPYVIGDFVWTSLDYLGESGIGRVHYEGEGAPFLGDYPWHHANCGDLDICGFKRPQSYYRDTLWHEDPRLYIAVHNPSPGGKTQTITNWGWPDVQPGWTWSGHEGENLKVEIYTNCDEIELFLDEQSQGRVSCTPRARHKALFEVVYYPGVLRAIGYRAGQAMIEQVISTLGEPARLQLTADRETVQADGFDLSFVTVKVLDTKGQPHTRADNEITFTISGPGKLLAVGNSNPISEELYFGNQRKVYLGCALVVIKSTEEAGEIVLTAQSDGLESSEVRILSRKKYHNQHEF